jgi:hypothetical protein
MAEGFFLGNPNQAVGTYLHGHLISPFNNFSSVFSIPAVKASYRRFQYNLVHSNIHSAFPELSYKFYF